MEWDIMAKHYSTIPKFAEMKGIQWMHYERKKSKASDFAIICFHTSVV